MSGFTLPWGLASRFQEARELRGGVSLALAYREALQAWCEAQEKEAMPTCEETRGTATGYAENSREGDFC